MAVPALGVRLSGLVTPLLALLMLAVSLTFDLAAVRAALARPRVLLLATVLVYVPMGIAGYALGRAAFGSGPVGVGFALVGVLPTDVSSPLLVLLGRGDVALATVCNAVTTALAPLLVPALLVLSTGVELDVPVVGLMGELAAVVLVPTVIGVTLRTLMPHRIEPVEAALSATSSLVYLALVLAVIGPNAALVLAAPLTVAGVAGLALLLNVLGYAIGGAAGVLVHDRRVATALLFTVSKKEFSIAAFLVLSAGLPPEVALPAVVYAVVQMVTSPLVAGRRARAARVG